MMVSIVAILAADAPGVLPSDPFGVFGQMTASGCLIWVVWYLHSKTLPKAQEQHAAMIKDITSSHSKSLEIMQAQATAANDIARSHFLQALEASQKQSADERKEAMTVVQALQKEYIQQVEFQRKQCTEEHAAKDRLLERLMERAGLPKQGDSGIIH